MTGHRLNWVMIPSTLLAVLAWGCGADNRPVPRADAGMTVEAGPGIDADTADDAGVLAAEGYCIAGVTDCGAGLECLCCPIGGPAQACICTSACTGPSGCTDPFRPTCDIPYSGAEGICMPPGLTCAWKAVCASPDTPIATPSGLRAIATLVPGDLVYSVHGEQVVAVPVAETNRTTVFNHSVVRVTLEGGDTLEISAGHPTADGRSFGDLVTGDLLDGVSIIDVSIVPYAHSHTYDILPASDTGTYFVGDVRIGSTLGNGRQLSCSSTAKEPAPDLDQTW